MAATLLGSLAIADLLDQATINDPEAECTFIKQLAKLIPVGTNFFAVLPFLRSPTLYSWDKMQGPLEAWLQLGSSSFRLGGAFNQDGKR